ncbi:MAG TPA: hypothetical protein VNO21_08250, partial [Polyangiaceae bacterium]|nr:hypothetical protein [Polyangiaceae bacterium]
ALASPDFLLVDLAGTSGRLDVLLRCLRAAMLVSHGLRSDTIAYLVLLGGPRAPRTLRVESNLVHFLRPDERSLAVLAQKALAVDSARGDGEFVALRRGISVADGGLEVVLRDLGPGTRYVLEEGAPDLRDAPLDARDPVFFVGAHSGFGDATRARLEELDAKPIAVGPVSLHAEDAIAVLSNELDRRNGGHALRHNVVLPR